MCFVSDSFKLGSVHLRTIPCFQTCLKFIFVVAYKKAQKKQLARFLNIMTTPFSVLFQWHFWVARL